MVSPEIRAAIKSQEWTFAQAYARTAPHEYIKQSQNPELFDAICKAIDKDGYIEKFWNRNYVYFNIDGYKYWHFQTILNRVNSVTKGAAMSEADKAQKKGKREILKKNKVLQTLNIEYVSVENIKPNSYNPNRQSEQDFKLLLKSMSEDGFTQPVIVQKETKTIVDGEHRWRASKELGYKELPVVFVDMTEEQMKISTLRHNRARGEEDIQLTAQVLKDLEQLGAIDWAQDSLQLDDLELERLLEDIPAPEALMGEEFGESWDPSTVHHDDAKAAQAIKDGNTEMVLTGGGMNVAHTAEATASMRQQQANIEKAKTEEERQMAKEGSNIFRLSLVFTGDEGKIVKEILGKRPAEKLVELCKSHGTPTKPQEGVANVK